MRINEQNFIISYPYFKVLKDKIMNYLKSLLGLDQRSLDSCNDCKTEQPVAIKKDKELRATEVSEFCLNFIRRHSCENHVVVRDKSITGQYLYFKCNDFCKFRGKIRRENFHSALDSCYEHSEETPETQESKCQSLKPLDFSANVETATASDAIAKTDLVSLRSWVLENRGYLMLSIDKVVLDAQIEDSNLRRAAIYQKSSKVARAESKNVRVGGKWLSKKFEDDCMLKALSGGK
jgi:hypothetical protein